MFRTTLALASLLTATSALAHDGHVAPAAGHAHWEIAAAPLAAIAAGVLIFVLRARRSGK